MELKTPLYERHVALGGKMVPYAGHLLPVQYPAGVIAEHKAVREACGLFDVSHMGEVRLVGPDALANLQNLLTNDFSGMAVGQVRYSPMCNAQGGVVDDVIVYRMGELDYLVVVNAANREKDVAWMRAQVSGHVVMTDESAEMAQFALQGPSAEKILRRFTPNLPKKYYHFLPDVVVAGITCLVSRTGYTGEKGYELYCKPADAPALWDALLAAGAPEGLIPCGLGARDTLRLEAGMPLYGHELSEEITPLEAGLDMFVHMDKLDFIGKAALLAKGTPMRRRVGLKMTGRGIAREGCDVYDGAERIGFVTSGTHAPFLGYAIAMAMLPNAYANVGQAVTVDVRGREVSAEVVPLPFYQRAK